MPLRNGCVPQVRKKPAEFTFRWTRFIGFLFVLYNNGEMDDEFAGYPDVEVEPGRVGGKPTLGKSRVPARLVAECLDCGETPEQIAYNYDLKLSEVLPFKQYRDSHQPAKRP